MVGLPRMEAAHQPLTMGPQCSTAETDVPQPGTWAARGPPRTSVSTARAGA